MRVYWPVNAPWIRLSRPVERRPCPPTVAWPQNDALSAECALRAKQRHRVTVQFIDNFACLDNRLNFETMPLFCLFKLMKILVFAHSSDRKRRCLALSDQSKQAVRSTLDSTGSGPTSQISPYTFLSTSQASSPWCGDSKTRSRHGFWQ